MRNVVPAARIAAVLLFATLPVGPARAGETPLGDVENPRNVAFRGTVVEWVGAFPRPDGVKVGDPVVWPDGTPIDFYAALRDLGGAPERARVPPKWTIDGAFRGAVPLKLPRPVRGATPQGIHWRSDGKRHAVAVSWGDDACSTPTDAIRVLVLVEKKTYEAGEKRFGSFVRRLRKSLDDLHALFEASVHPLAPRGVVERFRIDDVRLYERDKGRLVDFDDHPEFDLAIAVDEGGPVDGFSRSRCSIGHAFTGTKEHPGLWSSWGEQALWRDLLRSRGVPDYTAYEIAAGALPGRVDGPVALPARHARDLAASSQQKPALGELAAVVVNSRQGIARVDDPDDPESRHGHVWNWLPGRVDLALTRAGKPAAGATLRWWRSLSAPDFLDGATPGVAAGRAPDGTATADAAGKASIGGDYLGRSRPLEERSRWLLVEVEIEKERRFEVLYGLDLNLAYARGHKYVWMLPWRFEDLRPAGTSSPPPGR